MELLKSGANDRAIGGYTCPMICSRFIGGKSIPPEVIDAALKSVTNIGEALNPMKYKAGGPFTPKIFTVNVNKRMCNWHRQNTVASIV